MRECAAPGIVVEIAAPITLRQRRIMIKQVIRKLAPADLALELASSDSLERLLRLERETGPDLARGNLAPMKMGRQLRSARQIRAIPHCAISDQAVPHEFIKSSERAILARLPDILPPRRPVWFAGEQVPVFQLVAYQR